MRITVELPDALYRRSIAAGLDLSALLRHAVEDELGTADNTAWIAAVRARSPRCAPVIDTAALLDEARDEFGS